MGNYMYSSYNNLMGRTEQSKIREQLCVCVFQGKPDMSNRDFLRLCFLADTLEVFVTKGFKIADISQKLLSMYDACIQTIISISVRRIYIYMICEK